MLGTEWREPNEPLESFCYTIYSSGKKLHAVCRLLVLPWHMSSAYLAGLMPLAYIVLKYKGDTTYQYLYFFIKELAVVISILVNTQNTFLSLIFLRQISAQIYQPCATAKGKISDQEINILLHMNLGKPFFHWKAKYSTVKNHWLFLNISSKQ